MDKQIVIEKNIPDETKALPHWCVWKYVTRDGKQTKPPFQVDGSLAESDDPKTWADYQTAIRACRNGSRWNGPGFFLTDEYTGIDWDDCISEDGTTDPDILRQVKAIDSYTEVSPSGRGLKTLVHGKLPAGGHHKKFDNIEIGVFNRKRYFAMTGRALDCVSKNIEHRQPQLDALVKRYWPDDFKPKQSTTPLRLPMSLSDAELIEKARNARNGAKFGRLWDGYDGDYASSSEADQALCNMLAFWAGKNPARIDSLFRQSKLVRPKWDREDYRERTIARAIELTTEIYDPQHKTCLSAKSNSGKDYGISPDKVVEVQQALNSEIAEATHPMSVEDFWAYLPRHTYYCSTTRDQWPGASVNGTLPPVPCGVDDKGKQKFIQAATWLDKNRQTTQMTWDPSQPSIIENRVIHVDGYANQPGYRIINRYLAPRLCPGNANDIDPWFNHIKTIYPNDYPHMLLWFAHRAQRPGEKINHGLVMGGPQGIGKDTILEPVRYGVGTWNFTEISPVAMLGRFNPWVESVVLRVNEARDLGEMNRYSFYDHLKPYLASPPTVLPVDQKNQHVYPALNCLGVIFTTNELTTGMYLPADDRRHYVAWSESVKEDFQDEYWSNLWGWYAAGGIWNVAAYLRGLDISEFSPKAPPPQTDAWHQIVMANRQGNQGELADVLDALNNPMAVTIQQIIDKAQFMALTELSETLSDQTKGRLIPRKMAECDYMPLRNPYSKDGYFRIEGRRRGVYVQKNLSVRDQHDAAQKLVDGKA